MRHAGDARCEVYTKNKFENVWSLAETHGNGNGMAKYLRIIDCVWIWCYGKGRWRWQWQLLQAECVFVVRVLYVFYEWTMT